MRERAAAAAAELPAALQKAQEEAAAASAHAEQARAESEAQVARLAVQMDALPRLFGQWLPPELTMVSMDQESFVVVGS